MCEIIYIPCKVCGSEIEMHLGDFETNQNEIEVFCNLHIPEKDVVIWSDCKGCSTHGDWEIREYSKWYGVRALTNNARKNKDKNYPNIVRCEIAHER